jgi:hypothetical protein
MMTMTTMHFDTAIDRPVDAALDMAAPAAPVDDLLRVYLGQTTGGRAPAAVCAQKVPDAQDLWDYLGDFA